MNRGTTETYTLARLKRDAPELALVLDAILTLTAEVRELRFAITSDLAARASVLVALQAEFGTAEFTAIDALEAAAERPEGDLARALVPWLGGPVGGLRRLSRRLAKLVNKPAGGLTLTRIGSDRGSALYCVTQTVQWPV